MFFNFFLGVALVNPFVPIVAKNRLGLSATSLAVVVASHQLITIISKPIIGYIADYLNRLKLLINVMLIIQTISFLLILAIPPVKKSASFHEDQLRNWNTSKFITITVYASHSYNYSTSTPLTNMLNKNESEWDIKDNVFTEITCLTHINMTELLCFQKTGENITEFKFETESYCSYSTILTENLTDSVEVLDKMVNVRIVPLDPFFSDYNTNKKFPCNLSPIKNNEYSSNSTTKSKTNDFKTLEFWLFAVTNTIAGMCVNSVFSLSDTACCESVEKLGGEFGRQRLFGAIGWGVLVAISGLLCDLTDDFLASWIFMAVLEIIAVWNLSQLNLIKAHFSENLLKDVGRVLKSVEFTAFELGVFFNGMGAGIVWFYLIWFLSSLGASDFLCGLSQYIQCFIGEIPFMFFADWFIRKLGHFNLVSLSLLSYASRFLWYSYLQNPWLVLPAEIAHAFTYGTFFPTVASYGKLSAKPGTEATTQSILFMTHGGLGAGIGCILTGIGFDKIGTHQTFFYFCLLSFCAAVLNIITTIYFKRRNNKELNLTSVSNDL